MITACSNRAVNEPNGPEESIERFDTEAMRLVNETKLSFTGCIREQSLVLMDNHPDIRETAGLAVEACSDILTELDQQLEAKGMSPEFRNGVTRQMKGRSIRRLLPLLMMEKSSRTAQ
ncbi:MAG: hypothetical protein ACR2P9_03175 [Gammaproteobacteria bacterium]